MYFWNTARLAEDIKDDSLTDEDWKNYYLGGSILLILAMYIAMFSPRPDMRVVLFEAIALIGVIIFGISITYNTNQAGNGSGINYIARVTALSLPLLIKLFVLSLVLGFSLGIFSEIATISWKVQNWLMSVATIFVEILLFWRLNVHLRYITGKPTGNQPG